MLNDRRPSLKNPAQKLTHQSSPEGSYFILLADVFIALSCKRLFHAINASAFSFRGHASVDLAFPGQFSRRVIALYCSQCHFAFAL